MCYAPYNLWSLHGLWEMTILHALKLRGAEVKYVLCNGLYTDCDVFWMSTNPRHSKACVQCQNHVANLAKSMAMPYEWLGKYITKEEKEEARQWSENLDINSLPNSKYMDWDIGEWIKSSVHSHFRSSQLDLGNHDIQEGYRSYLYSGLMACFGLNRLLDEYNPEVLFVFNGRMSSTRVAFELAKRRDIQIICHERGFTDESILLFQNTPCLSLVVFKQLWQGWGNFPLNQVELIKIDRYMDQRQYGKNLNWRAFSPAPQEYNELYKKLNLSHIRPVWVLFTSSGDEVASSVEWQGVFTQQIDWIRKTIAYAGKHPFIDLVIRIHPNTGGAKSTGKNIHELQEFEYLKPSLPQNVRMVMPDDPISSYTLMEVSTLGLIYQSTAGLEMACKGKNVIVASGCYVSDLPFVKTVKSIESYENLLDSMLNLPVMFRSVEIQRLAHRFAYSIFFRLNTVFPLIKMPNPHSGLLGYKTLNQLAKGMETNLDRICRIILEREHVYMQPSDEDHKRSEVYENEWFADKSGSRQNFLEYTAKQRPALYKNMSPRVSVVIPCYNYGHFLEAAVKSVLQQTFQNFEIIIVNDGSPDNTQQVAEDLIISYPDRIISLINQQNAGQPAIPRNKGIAQAKGEYIVCLDADDMIAPHFLRECLTVLDENTHICIAVPSMQMFGDSHVFVPAQEYSFERLKHQNIVLTASMFRKKAWEASGGYATNVKGYEDWDFWIGCGERKHFGQAVPTAIFFYRVSNEGLGAKTALKHAQTRKAQIILNHSRSYSAFQKKWAKDILKKDPRALTIGTRPDLIPAESEITALRGMEMNQSSIEIQLAQARRYLNTGQQNEALVIYNHLFKHYPENISVMMALGGYCQRIGDFTSARTIYENVLKLQPNHPEAKKVLSILS
jgi:glycosyltransferase involved in cell wall biosynthesis